MTASATQPGTGPTADSLAPSGRRFALLIAGLGLVAGVVLFHELGDFRTLGSHEGYAIVPARAMLESGNWIVPRFAGLPRLRKPPLAYWVIATSASVFGELNEWTARFPAACAAVLLSAVIGIWAGRWYGRTAGLGAALVQMTSAYVLNFGRKAEVDMLLCLLTTTALFLVADQSPNESRRRSLARWCAIYCLLSLSWLAKFHYGPAMVLAVVVTYFAVQRQFRSFWRLLNPLGLLVLAAALVVWPWLLLRQVPEALQIWQEETVGRAVGDLGTEPLWYYVPHLFVLALPWTPLAVAAAPSSWRAAWKGGDSRERFLWVWLLVQLAIVTASADKHSHYLLAAMPMLSLLAGRQFNVIVARVADGRRLPGTRQAAAGTALVVIGAAIAASALASTWDYLVGPVVAVVVMAAGGVVTALWLLVVQRPNWAGLAVMSALLGCSIGVNGWIMPGRDHRLPAAQFARKLRAELPQQSEVFAYGMGERNPVVFYLGSPVSRCESIAAVEAELAKSGPMLVLAYESDVLPLAQLAEKTHLVQAMLVEPGELAPKHPPLVLLELEQPVYDPADLRRQASHGGESGPRR